jgi:hypothetical protein
MTVAKLKSTVAGARGDTSRRAVRTPHLHAATDPDRETPFGSQSRSSRSSDSRDDQSVWLSVAQAAARAGNHPRTIKRWIAAKYLRANRLPSPKGKGPLRVRLGDVEALIARGALA